MGSRTKREDHISVEHLNKTVHSNQHRNSQIYRVAENKGMWGNFLDVIKNFHNWY